MAISLHSFLGPTSDVCDSSVLLSLDVLGSLPSPKQWRGLHTGVLET